MPCTLGIDLGTSGVRAVVLQGGVAAASGKQAVAPDVRQDPAALWEAVASVLRSMDLAGVQAVAVDGTSGTILPVGAKGQALGPLQMYGQVAEAGLVAAVAAVAPAGSAARGATSPLARAIALQSTPGLARILHEADWIAGRLCGRFDTADANNALKTGYDPVQAAWPAWIGAAGLRMGVLPRVLPPGAAIGPVSAAARALGLPAQAVVAAGTTDGCASFLATGAAQPGDGVTALGSTLTIKLLSPQPVSDAGYGVYSHRLRGLWLAGGGGNTGGAVLAQHFTPGQLAALSARIDPARPSTLDYYPLLRPGERFPVNDPAWPPRLLPRPADDVAFLHGLLEGMARIEALGYRRLAELGAPPLRRVLSVGGGAANPAWTGIRARVLGVPVAPAPAADAARGAALLAGDALPLDALPL